MIFGPVFSRDSVEELTMLCLHERRKVDGIGDDLRRVLLLPICKGHSLYFQLHGYIIIV